jgi:chromosome segregation ATPase
MGMIKKLVLTTVAVTGGLYVLNHSWPGSVHTWWKKTRVSVESKISPEFELARIRDQIAELTPDMHRNISRIAEEMVEVKTLEARASDLGDRLAKSKNDLKVFSDAVENNVKLVSTTGRTVTVTAGMVKDKLRTCKNIERELGHTQKVLEAKQAGLEAAREQLSVMKTQRETLKEMAENFEAELKTLKLEQTRAKIKLDDSRLGEIKESFEKLRARIEVERKKVDLAGQLNSDSLLAPERKIETKEETLDEARGYLNGPAEKTESAKK